MMPGPEAVPQRIVHEGRGWAIDVCFNSFAQPHHHKSDKVKPRPAINACFQSNMA